MSQGIHHPTLNPFASGTGDAFARSLTLAVGDADALSALLLDRSSHNHSDGCTSVFRARACDFSNALAPALVWLRDVKSVTLDIEMIRLAIELKWVWTLAIQKTATVRNPDTGSEYDLDLNSDVPDDVIQPLLSYLTAIAVLDTDIFLDRHGEIPFKLHSYTQIYLAKPLWFYSSNCD